jgi:hypothetical protein
VVEVERRQAAYDALLSWCSELGSGTYEQFRRGCQSVRIGASAAARVLSVLGHVEFSWRTRRFSCAPPTLTTIAGMPGRFLLCGQRTLGALENLRLAADHASLDVDVARQPAHQFGAGPGTVVIDADAPDAEQLAHIAGLIFAPDAATAIARSLPVLALDTAGEPATPDERFPHCPVDPDTLDDRWDAEPDVGYADGLWAWRTYRRQRELYLRRGGEWWYLPVAEHGAYLIERPADASALIEYDAASRVLAVDSRAALPELHARAACLCSGRLPLNQPYAPGFAYEHYVNVTVEVAATITASLTPTEGSR